MTILKIIRFPDFLRSCPLKSNLVSCANSKQTKQHIKRKKTYVDCLCFLTPHVCVCFVWVCLLLLLSSLLLLLLLFVCRLCVVLFLSFVFFCIILLPTLCVQHQLSVLRNLCLLKIAAQPIPENIKLNLKVYRQKCENHEMIWGSYWRHIRSTYEYVFTTLHV